MPPANYNDRVHTVLDSGSVLTYMEDTALAKLHDILTSKCQQGHNPKCENATKGSTGFPVSPREVGSGGGGGGGGGGAGAGAGGAGLRSWDRGKALQCGSLTVQKSAMPLAYVRLIDCAPCLCRKSAPMSPIQAAKDKAAVAGLGGESCRRTALSVRTMPDLTVTGVQQLVVRRAGACESRDVGCGRTRLECTDRRDLRTRTHAYNSIAPRDVHAHGRWWNRGPYKILCFETEEGVPREAHLQRMPWLHFIFLVGCPNSNAWHCCCACVRRVTTCCCLCVLRAYRPNVARVCHKHLQPSCTLHSAAIMSRIVSS